MHCHPVLDVAVAANLYAVDISCSTTSTSGVGLHIETGTLICSRVYVSVAQGVHIIVTSEGVTRHLTSEHSSIPYRGIVAKFDVSHNGRIRCNKRVGT